MIVVFGSVNLDLVTRVTKIPAPGETVLGPSYEVVPGGKGANQALAARRAGARVMLVAAVGRDAFAAPALSLLSADGVDLAAVARLEAPTGAAFIAVDAQAENAIVVASGANAHAKASQLDGIGLGAGDILLLQREVPDAEAEAAAHLAKRRGARVVLNLAPAGPIPRSYLDALDVLVLNEHEAVALGTHLGLPDLAPQAVAAALDAQFRVATIVTLGAEGAVGFVGGKRHAVGSLPVDVVDTTAAGDAFVGAFAAALERGLSFDAAMARGAAAGSLACAKPGAQTSLPFAAEIEAGAARLIPLE
jgi:ribokinase